LKALLKLSTPSLECNSDIFGKREVTIASETRFGTTEALTAMLYTPRASRPRKGRTKIWSTQWTMKVRIAEI
jgi:hypothetical protein